MKTKLETMSFSVAKMTIRLCSNMVNRRVPYVLVNQLLKSGTSIGANIAESRHGQTRADFAAKLSIASKEAQETNYWLQLMRESSLISDEESSEICRDVEQLCRMLAATRRTLYGENQ